MVTSHHQKPPDSLVSNDSNAAAVTTDSSEPAVALAMLVERSLRQYLKALGDEPPSHLYELMLHQLEKPLLTVVLEYTRGNQTRTAEILGLNRGTLRKKLKTHGLM